MTKSLTTFRITKKGFTLVETLVAISIIMVGVLGPFTLIENNINAAYISRDEIAANSLAQEGIEEVRLARDSVYLYNRLNSQTSTFLAYVDGTGTNASNCFTPNVCAIDPTQSVSSPTSVFPICNGGTCSPLYIRSDYTYTQIASGNTQSKFTRQLQLCYMNGSTCSGPSYPSSEVKAVVTVSWVTLGKSYQTSVTDYLQNWLQ